MAVHRIEIPYAVDLTKEREWSSLDQYTYFILRFHLYIEDYQAMDTSFPGQILATFHTTEHSETEVIRAIERELSEVDVKETIRAQIFSEEFVANIASEVTSNIEIPTFVFSTSAKAALEQKIASSISTTSKQTHSVTRRKMERFEIHQKILPGGDEKIHAVACYKQMRRDVYLHYIDYLLVEYKTSFWGIRKKKKNLPRPIGNNHINRIKINLPLVSIFYWKLLPDSSYLVSDTAYGTEEKIIRPEDITVERLDKPINLPLPRKPQRPTLYTLSNIAFPYRWIEREGEWTKEELMAIEMDEAEGSAWWFRHGSGGKK